MCLIITKTISGKVDWPAADRAAKQNPDGYGVAYPNGKGRVTFHKSLSWKPVRDKAVHLQKAGVPFILHMRYATHGKVSKANCHPFRLDDHNLVMAHNGVISSQRMDIPAGMCDSRVLANHINELLPQGFLSDSGEVDYVNSLADSSRLSFMDGYGNLFFINEDLGAWSNGVWYSQPTSILKTVKASSKVYDPTKWDDDDDPATDGFFDNYATRRYKSFGVKTHPNAPKAKKAKEAKGQSTFRYTGKGPNGKF